MADLPTGTVTFLFTDIEGSTRLWEQHPEAMQAALARHDSLAAETVSQHHGTLVTSRGEGDSLFAVFARASDAVAVAAALQQALVTEPWPNEAPLRVRMALHTGEADLRAGSYYGSEVNRCARLRAVTHAGQVLLSRTTYDLVRDTLPEGASLRDLGEHRLRDLTRPEHIFQLLHPALPAGFPPLQTLEAHPHNLPVQPTPLIGREREIETVRALIQRETGRLVTLTGPGGIGKTRLALQIAADTIDQFPNGAFLVALAPITNPGLVPSAIAQALGIGQAGGAMLLQNVKEYLRHKQLLLVLDNFEQLLPAAPLVAELLAEAPGLKVLVTSRAALRLEGEQEFPVHPLPVPDPRRLPPLASVSQYAAVELFIQRALAVKPDFAVTNENAPAVAEICHRLDGLPLAIVLAAARVKLLPPRVLLARLKDRLPLLTGGARDLPERHQTLRGAIAWSYDMLGEAEQQLFRRLSVFVGGCTLEAAEAVCKAGDEREIDVLERIAALVDHSLVIQEDAPTADPEAEDEPRFTMLETIREFARDCLREAGETEPLREQHLAWAVALAERAGPELFGGGQATWLARLEREHDNLRAALDWALEGGNLQAGMRIGGSVWRFWHQRGFRKEGYERIAAVLSRPEAAERTPVRAKALDGAGTLAINLDNAAARAHYEEMLAIGREREDQRILAVALNGLGHASGFQGEPEQSRAFYEQGLALAREVSHRWEAAYALHSLGNAATDRGERDLARALSEEALAIWRGLGDGYGMVFVLNEMGWRAVHEGDYRAATARFTEILALGRKLRGNALGMGLYCLGWVVHLQGDNAAARSYLEERLALFRERGDPAMVADALCDLGRVLLKQGELEVARTLFEESLAAWREAGDPWGWAESAVWGCGDVAWYRGDYEEARSVAEECLAKREKWKRGAAGALLRLASVAQKQGELTRAATQGQESLARYGEALEGSRHETAEFLEGFGNLAGALGQPRRAVRLLGAAAAFREASGLPLPPVDRPDYERTLAAARAALGETEFAVTWAEGRAMSIEQATSCAVQEESSHA